MPLVLIQADNPKHIVQVRDLFLEYAESLGFNLCFQDFETELARLPGDYVPPYGRLVLALLESMPVGCAALHRLTKDICEIKRLYVRPAYRGRRIGSELTEHMIIAARMIGYVRMRLDTIAPSMAEAIKIYRRIGFKEIPPYRENPIKGAVYLELSLAEARLPSR